MSIWTLKISSVQFSSVAQSCLTLCDSMNHSTPGLPVHHQLPEFTQTHVHRVSDAIQPSHPLSSPSPPVPNPSQHQGLSQWVNSSHEVAKVLEFQLQHHSIQKIPGLISFRMDRLDLLAVQGTLKSLLQHYSPEQGYYWWLKGTKLCWRTVVNVPGPNFKLISVSLNVFPCFIGSCFLVCEKNVTISIDSGKMIVISVQCHIPVLCFNYF